MNSENVTAGPIAALLLRLTPHIIPTDTSLYRLVLEHGYFGIHNMSITMDTNGQPPVNSSMLQVYTATFF